jgi:hypothetical protein
LRQQWLSYAQPVGLTIPLMYSVFSGRTQLPWKACNQTGIIGSGGVIELIDLFLGGSDKSKHYATIGFAQYVQPPGDGGASPDVLAKGLCFGNGTYSGDPKYRLGPTEMSSSAGYPPGLPPPMPLVDATGSAMAWKIGPTRAKRVDTDFSVPADRTKLLSMTDTADAGAPANDDGVFFYDDTTGRLHGFSRLTWMVLYNVDGTSFLAVPLREVETNAMFNDRMAPNCIGQYFADSIDPTFCQGSLDPKVSAWGGGCCYATAGSAICQPGQSAASMSGYFLITELQQIYSPDLQETMCVAIAGNDVATSKPIVDAQGFYDAPTASCITSKWNPSDATSGLPKGDWCAATNSAATDDCHDAWRSTAFQVFAGAKIQLASNGTPALCSF